MNRTDSASGPFSRKNAHLSRLLVQACSMLESYGIAMNSELLDFWNKFKESERIKIEIIKKRNEEERIRFSALNKLTKEERVVLGFESEILD